MTVYKKLLMKWKVLNQIWWSWCYHNEEKMFYPARWKKITVDQSKVLKNWLHRLFRFLWATRYTFKIWTLTYLVHVATFKLQCATEFCPISIFFTIFKLYYCNLMISNSPWVCFYKFHWPTTHVHKCGKDKLHPFFWMFIQICAMASAKLHLLIQSRPIKSTSEACFFLGSLDEALMSSIEDTEGMKLCLECLFLNDKWNSEKWYKYTGMWESRF